MVALQILLEPYGIWRSVSVLPFSFTMVHYIFNICFPEACWILYLLIYGNFMIFLFHLLVSYGMELSYLFKTKFSNSLFCSHVSVHGLPTCPIIYILTDFEGGMDWKNGIGAGIWCGFHIPPWISFFMIFESCFSYL